MRRKSTGHKQASNSFRILEDFDPEKLQLFAAVMLAWNYIETFLDATMNYSLRLRVELFAHVSSRINGIDGKVAILKEALLVYGANDKVREILGKTINAVEAYKKLRDGVAHVRIPHPTADIADTIQRRGISDEVLISKEALRALYERLCMLQNEMSLLFKIMHAAAMGDLLTQDSEKMRHADQAEQFLLQLQEAQRFREALPPLPKSGPTPNSCKSGSR